MAALVRAVALIHAYIARKCTYIPIGIVPICTYVHTQKHVLIGAGRGAPREGRGKCARDGRHYILHADCRCVIIRITLLSHTHALLRSIMIMLLIYYRGRRRAKRAHAHARRSFLPAGG